MRKWRTTLKHLASDVFESYSAGTETKQQIDQNAVRIMKELYGIDKVTKEKYEQNLEENLEKLLVHVVYIGIRCYVKDWREERGYY